MAEMSDDDDSSDIEIYVDLLHEIDADDDDEEVESESIFEDSSFYNPVSSSQESDAQTSQTQYSADYEEFLNSWCFNYDESTGRFRDPSIVEPGWCVEENIFKRNDFTGIPGPKNIPLEIKNPGEFWNLFIPNDLLESIVEFTNEYASTWKNTKEVDFFDPLTPMPNKFRKQPWWLAEWKPITLSELKKFIACLYVIGIVRLPNLNLYWSDAHKYFHLTNIR